MNNELNLVHVKIMGGGQIDHKREKGTGDKVP